jgi:hypothetical protein
MGVPVSGPSGAYSIETSAAASDTTFKPYGSDPFTGLPVGYYKNGFGYKGREVYTSTTTIIHNLLFLLCSLHSIYIGLYGEPHYYL